MITLKQCRGALLLLTTLIGSPAFAQTSNDSTIPAERRIDWSPGIPSGIPNLAICANVKNAPYNAKGDGVTDDAPAIQAAIDSVACKNGGAVFLPAGTYRASKQITITLDSPSGRTTGLVLRGEGPHRTTIVGYADSTQYAQILIRGGGQSAYQLTGGYTKDSRTLTLSNTTGITGTSNQVIRVLQDNDPSVINGTLPSVVSGQATYYQTQTIPIVSKSGNTLTLGRPLYYSYSSNFNVRAYVPEMISNAGVEDLKIDQKGGTDSTISFLRAKNCWVKNVEAINTHWHHVSLDQTYGCEIRHNYFHHAQTYGQGGYGISVSMATDNLVEDNVFYYLRHSMVVQNGASGNVIGYNYSSRMFDAQYPNTDYLITDLEFHGGHPNMNLFEGNVGTAMMADNYWGSSRHNTFFRNYVTRYSLGESKPIKYGLWAVRLDAQNLYYNVVGNVLGRVGDTGDVWLIGRDGNYYSGGVNISPQHPVDDPQVESTLINHGNVDRINNKIEWENSNHTLRSTYYLTSRPNFGTKPQFFGTMTWPAIGPDVNGYVLPIPAQKCFEDYYNRGLSPCPTFSSTLPNAPQLLRLN